MIYHLLTCIAVWLMPAVQAYMSTSRRLELRDQAKEMFFHGWNTYLNVAYPEDELRPLTCRGLGSTRYSNDNSNDVLGDYSLTLVDTLDTLAMIGTQEQFEDAVRRVLTDVSFDKNNKVQVFELNIRALGGLLSAHILATEPAYGRQIKGYQGGLLDLAVDLADRFLPAFYKSKTGIPFPRVNLRYGVPRSETVETCTAGAGSLILEFGVLSRLTGNPEYERVAKHALLALWEQRSSLNLMGNVIDIQTGEWILPMASTGAGIDSFYEYLLKAYVLFGDKEYLDVFDTAYEAIMRHVVDRSGFLYRNVHMQSGALLATWIDSLSAFMPGLQVLYGDLDAAIKGHLVFFNLWRRYHALPERYDFYQQDINIGYYPLRPEFVESNYYLYRATKDPFYLQVGEMVLLDLNNRSRIDCGFASMGNVLDGRLEDRMESFMLSETLKYLYLLFDAEHPVNSLDNNFVFTTEGHFLPLASDYLTTLSEPKINTNETRPLETTRPSKHTRSTCPKYQPRGFRDLANATGSLAVHQVAKPRAFDLSSLPYHPLYDYAAGIMQYGHNASDPFAQTAALTDPELTSMRHRHGHCSHPILYQHRYELTFGTDNRPAYQQTTPQILEMIGGLLTKSFSGLRLELLKLPRSQGGGYIVAGVGVDHSLNESQIFATTMDAIEPFVVKGQIDLMLVKEGWRPRPWQTWIEEQTTQPVVLDDWKNNVAIRMQGRHESRSLRASLSQFGPPFPLADDKVVLAPSQLAYFLESQGDQRFYGCDGYSEADKARIQGKILLVSRGECTFTRKMWWAQKAGAKAVLFVNNLANAGPFQARTLNKDEDWSLFALKQPSFFHEDTAIPHRHSVTIPSATLTREAGVALLDFLNLNDQVAIHVIQQPPLLMNDPSKWLGVKVHGVKVHNWVVLKV